MSGVNVRNQSACLQDSDKYKFLQGSTGNAFTAWLIDAFYNTPILTKRQEAQKIPIPPGQYDNLFVQFVNTTATNLNLTFNESKSRWLTSVQELWINFTTTEDTSLA